MLDTATKFGVVLRFSLIIRILQMGFYYTLIHYEEIHRHYSSFPNLPGEPRIMDFHSGGNDLLSILDYTIDGHHNMGNICSYQNDFSWRI